MSTATVAAPASREVTIAEAQAVFAAAKAAEWPEDGRRAIWEPFRGLSEALADYHALVNGIVPVWFPGMRPGREGKEAALALAADRAWEAAEGVSAVMGEYGIGLGAGDRGE